MTTAMTRPTSVISTSFRHAQQTSSPTLLVSPTGRSRSQSRGRPASQFGDAEGERGNRPSPGSAQRKPPANASSIPSTSEYRPEKSRPIKERPRREPDVTIYLPPTRAPPPPSQETGFSASQNFPSALPPQYNRHASPRMHTAHNTAEGQVARTSAIGSDNVPRAFSGTGSQFAVQTPRVPLQSSPLAKSALASHGADAGHAISRQIVESHSTVRLILDERVRSLHAIQRALDGDGSMVRP